MRNNIHKSNVKESKHEFDKYIQMLGDREEYMIFGGKPEWNEKTHTYRIAPTSLQKTTMSVKKEKLFDVLKNLQSKGWSVWVSLNEKESDKIEGVTAIHTLWFDFDAPRTSKSRPASEEERKKAYEEAVKFKEFMEKRYNVQGFLACSGNGYHLFFPVPRFGLPGRTFRKEFNKKQGTWMKKLKEETGANFDTTTDIRRVTQPIGFPNVKIPDHPLSTYWIDNFTSKDILVVREKNQKLIDEILDTELVPISQHMVEMSNKKSPELTELLAKDNKLKDLYFGDWRKYDYPSRSEAELSLIIRLVCYGVADEKIREYMQNSKIGKWIEKSDSYRNLTIEKARIWVKKHGCKSQQEGDTQLLRLTLDKRDKNGKKYYYAVRLTNRDVSKVKVEVLDDGDKKIVEILETWFIFPLRVYLSILDPNTKTWYYNILIENKRELLSKSDVINKLVGKGSILSEYKIKQAFANILHGLRYEGLYKEIEAKYTALGVYLKEDGTFDFALYLEDGVFPISSSKARKYQELILMKGIPTEEQMEEAFEFLLKVFQIIDDPIERVNTILLFGWGMLAPFNYVFRQTKRFGHYFILYGVKNSGKTMRASLLKAGYGGFEGPNGDTLNKVFRLGSWAQATTTPILADDIKGLPDSVLIQLKSGIESTTIVERGLPNQETKQYGSFSSFFITSQDIDWLTNKKDKEASARMDRFIIGLEETKIKKVKDLKPIKFKGNVYVGESLKEATENIPPWALRVTKDFVDFLNKEEKGLFGLKKLDTILANINQAMLNKLNELGISEETTTRELEQMTRIFVGLKFLIEEIKRYFPKWEEYKEKLAWFFDMQDLIKFVYFLTKNWLGKTGFAYTFGGYIFDIKKAYDYWEAWQSDTFTKKRDLLTKTGYNFDDDIVIYPYENLICLTPAYIKKANRKFEKEGIGSYSTLSAFAEDYAKVFKKRKEEIYKNSKTLIKGERPKILTIDIHELYDYLYRDEVT